MDYARMTTTTFKPGLRAEGIRTIEGFIKEGDQGFKGHFILAPLDEPDKVVFITLWSSEEAMDTSWKRSSTVKSALEDMLAQPVEMSQTQVLEMELLKAGIKA
ncbi:MAG: hypothetical protein ISF22_07505 [Methanomassiliicoccus sp.]|nr:hypothetical protein [Methanomassiliicoccus sp.]